jgi:hypothetical protein
MNYEDRLLKLEKENHRLKQLGTVALVVAVSLLVMGQASQKKKTVEADEFILKDNGGNVRARLSMNILTGAAPGVPAVAQLVLFDEKGKKRVMLDGGNTWGFSGLSLYDEQERARGYFTETDSLGLGATLMLQDEQGHLQTRLKGGEVMALDNVTASRMQVDDAEGFAATLGATDLVTPRTGEKHKTSAASLVLFDKDKNVIWKAP